MISVQVKQVIDSKVAVNDIVKFNSAEKFRERLRLRHQNWQRIWGKYSIINIYSDVIAPGCCFYGATTGFNEYEIWEIVSIDMQEKKKPNLINS